jgi:hypothetical protein
VSGVQALYNNSTGNQNTANGYGALSSNTTGVNNTGDGLEALYNNSTGGNNTAVGLTALLSNTTGSSNTALGLGAGSNLTTGSNNIDIGNAGVAAESNSIRVGTTGTQTATFIAGIRGVAVAGGQPVAVNANGQLGIRASSARFKENIKPMDKASEAILSLQPVVFRYKKEIDPNGAPQFGLIAEEVAKVDPDLVARDDEGKPFTVRYDEVDAMLLNEFLKEHRKVEEQDHKLQEQEATIAQLKAAAAKQEAVNAEQRKGMEIVTAHLKEQDAKIQKASDKVELSKPAPRTVDNNQ